MEEKPGNSRKNVSTKGTGNSAGNEVTSCLGTIFAIFVLICVAVTAIFMIVMWFQTADTYFFHSEKIERPEMIEVRREDTKDSDDDPVTYYYITYQYKYEGEKYTEEDPTSYRKEPHVGRKSIRIDKRNPSIILAKTAGIMSYLLVLICLGLLLLIVYSILKRLEQRRKWRNDELAHKELSGMLPSLMDVTIRPLLNAQPASLRNSGIPLHAAKILEQQGYHSLDDLTGQTLRSLGNLKGIGRQSLIRMLGALRKHGYLP
ncbi:MAG: hypothetical protein U0L49_03340 [Eubacterium sp.]|nr:hypothetical protein [Eubacterium sp.]